MHFVDHSSKGSLTGLELQMTPVCDAVTDLRTVPLPQQECLRHLLVVLKRALASHRSL